MLVHFPTALLPMDLIFSMLAVLISKDELYEPAYYCLMAGVASGWLAILAGMFDLFRHILRQGAKATRKALIHGGIQGLIVLAFTVFLSLEYKNQVYITQPPAWLWIGKTVLILVMLYGNYLGGELVMKYIAKEFQHEHHGPDSHH